MCLRGEHYFFGKPCYFTQTLTTNATIEGYFHDDPQFPDPRLEAMIRYALEPDNPSGPLTSAQLESLTELTIVNAGITNLTGLNLCTNLTELFIGDNPGLTDIAPLQYLVNLEYLYLSNNGIQDIAALVNNTGLGEGDTIYIENNPLTAQALYLQAYGRFTREVQR